MTDRIRARLIIHEVRTPAHALFSALDTKGRRFGARVRVEVIEYAPADEATLGRYLIAPENMGRWMQVRPHATRDGQDYGAWQSGKRFRTEDEVQAYIAKYFAEAEKRALKNKNRKI